MWVGACQNGHMAPRFLTLADVQELLSISQVQAYSLVRSGDLLYGVNQGGDAFVFRAAPKFELLATNDLGERTLASYTVIDGALFIRSETHLWKIIR